MSDRRHLLVLGLLGWFSCFVVLAQLGTWTPFVFVGVLLVALALQSSAVPLAQFRPNRQSLTIGMGAGVLMVLFTHLVYRWLSAVYPVVSSATLELLSLLEVADFAPPARTALIVVIASCEEVLFRGLLLDATSDGGRPLRMPSGREWRRLLLWSLAYAFTTVPLESPLLVLCAFVCGTLWGILRVATGSVLVPILSHLLWDLGVLLVWPLAS